MDTIDLQEAIQYTLAVQDAKTGAFITNFTLSNVVWNQTNPIGSLAPTKTPNVYLFTPSKPGTTDISATAIVTLP
jgi:hypothetical protein